MQPLHVPGYTMTHCWHLYIIRLDIERMTMTRDGFMQALKEKQIGTGLHFRATHGQKYYREKYLIPWCCQIRNGILSVSAPYLFSPI